MNMQTMSPNDSRYIIVKQSTRKHRRKFYKKKNWLCDRCGSVYSTRDSFIQHMAMHRCPSDKPYKCEYCQLGFQVPSALKSHRRVHQKNQLKCEKCDKIFTRKQNYLGHMLIHEGKEPFKCDLCGDEFPFKSLLKYHIRTHTGEHFACKICNKLFSYKSSWNNHMKLHCTNGNLSGKHCQKSNENEGTLAMHSQLHKDRDQCDCSVCGIMHENGKRVRLRQAPQDFVFLKPVSCTECNMKFYDVVTLRRHMESKHKDKFSGIISYRSITSHQKEIERKRRNRKEQREKKKFVCGYMKCRARFLNEEQLNTHKLIHTRKNKKTFTCSLCSKEFTKKVRLEYHMMEHSGKYECEVCGAIFKCKAHLTRHKRQHFTQETHPHSCSQCDRLFKFESSLRAHLKWHTTICKYCLLEFTSEKDLENHLTICKQANTCKHTDVSFGAKLESHLLLHDEMEHLACPQGPAALSNSDLKSHTTNEGKKAYECDMCDMSYLSAVYLAEHVKEKHKDDQFKCGHCDKTFRRKKQLEKHVMTHVEKTERPKIKRQDTDKLTHVKKTKRSEVKRQDKDNLTHETKTKRPEVKRQDKDKPPKFNAKKPYQCSVCNLQYSTHLSLLYHQRLHKGIIQLTCQRCNVKFSDVEKYVDHQSTHADIIKLFRCGYCNISFCSQVFFVFHMRTCEIKKLHTPTIIPT